MSCRADNYNEEQRVRHTIRSVVPVDTKEHIKMLVKDLESNGVELPDSFDKSKYM